MTHWAALPTSVVQLTGRPLWQATLEQVPALYMVLFSTVLAVSTTKRPCVPLQIGSSSSLALIANDTLRPSTAAAVTVAGVLVVFAPAVAGLRTLSHRVELEPDVAERARQAVERMLQVGAGPARPAAEDRGTQ